MRKQLFIILIGLAHFGYSQDMRLSLYDASQMTLNPAMTGVFDADYRLHVQYRTQWRSVNYRPYQSMLASFDMPFKNTKWSIGVQLTNFRAGAGNFSTTQGLISTSYNTAIDKNKNHGFTFGVQAGVMQKSLEYELLSFNNQYSYNNGGHFDQTIANNENFGAQSTWSPVVNVGVMYYYAKQQARFNPFVGISAFNLLNPKETFFDQNNRLPIRTFVNLGTRINITETFYLIPKVLLQFQRKFSEQTVAVDMGYFLKNSDVYLLAGVVHRINDAMVVTGGVKFNNFILKMAYDINVSKLSNISTGRGGFEIALTYLPRKSDKSSTKICPRL